MKIPYAFHSYIAENDAEGRWDQQWFKRMLDGEEHVPPGGFEFEKSDFATVIEQGGVLILPVGSYHEHGIKHVILKQVWNDMMSMPWGVVIATSDECSTFDWHKIDPWPEHIRLWVTTPRPDKTYPPNTVLIGNGAPSGVDRASHAITRDLDIALVGQGGHERRRMAFASVTRAADQLFPGRRPARTVIRETPGFAQGVQRDDFLFLMSRAWLAPAPSGPCTQDTFRAYEALESGCVPLLDGLRQGGRGAGYWEMVGMGDVAPVIDDWDMFGPVAAEILDDRCWFAARVQSRWQAYKRNAVRTLHASVQSVSGYHPTGMRPVDRITVVVPSSPIPSHPDPSMTIATVRSVLDLLPGVEVLITCDGVRPEQEDRLDDYHQYLWELCEWAMDWPNVTPVVHSQHMHQSGMMRAVLPEISTEFVLYVEHDAPLVGDIPWEEVLHSMDAHDLNLMRFMHTSEIIPEHEHLFFDSFDDGPDGVRWTQTVQWSQRPHLARTGMYEAIMKTYFGSLSRTFIEDVMHGVVQDGGYTPRARAQERFDTWRMGAYTPEGDMQRSAHSNGRGSDLKYAMWIQYDGEQPDGAPAEGWMG